MGLSYKQFEIDMGYGTLHRFLLRSVASRGVMTVSEVENLISTRNLADEAVPVVDLVKEINDQIKPFQQTIKITNDELTNEVVLVFLSLGFDDATKSQNIFNATELEFFRILIEQVMTTEARQITGIQAINLVGGMKSSFTKTDAQRLLNTWCKMRYLDKDQNNYALGVRAINEFEGYLRQNMPETIEECCLCKQIVFRGCNCPFCAVAIHTRCLNKYLEKVEKWPCCKVDFSASQLERLHSGEKSDSKQNKRLTKKSCESDPFFDTDDEDISPKKRSKSVLTKCPPRAEVKNQGSSSNTSEWLFDSESDSEVSRVPSSPNKSVSILTRRVPGGVTRRTAQLNGDLLVELRLYNQKEVYNLNGLDRCERAIVWIRLQGEAESPEFKVLKKFVKLAKTKFTAEGTFYKDKIKK